jgi:hypothetical protein
MMLIKPSEAIQSLKTSIPRTTIDEDEPTNGQLRMTGPSQFQRSESTRRYAAYAIHFVALTGLVINRSTGTEIRL